MRFTDTLQINATKTQAMTLGKSEYIYNPSVGDQTIEIEPTLKILDITLDKQCLINRTLKLRLIWHIPTLLRYLEFSVYFLQT